MEITELDGIGEFYLTFVQRNSQFHGKHSDIIKRESFAKKKKSQNIFVNYREEIQLITIVEASFD